VPEFQLATEIARKVLPRSVPHQDAVYNTSRVGFFITAMMLGDYTNLSLAMEDLLQSP
jgi:homoserine kinase